VYIQHLFLWFGSVPTVPLKAVENFIPRLRSFENVRTLTFYEIDTTKLSQPNLAVHFPKSLTVLDLRKCNLEISTFIAFFSSLPTLQEFHSQRITLSGPTVIPTKPISESLRVLDIVPDDEAQRGVILRLFATHPLAYQELHFDGEGAIEPVLSLIAASTETLERLSLPVLTECSCALIPIHLLRSLTVFLSYS
jgi:hypothetical protein